MLLPPGSTLPDPLVPYTPLFPSDGSRCSWRIRHAAERRCRPERRLRARGKDRRGSSSPEPPPSRPTAWSPRPPRRRQGQSVPGPRSKSLAPSLSPSIPGQPHRLLEQVERDVAAAQYRRDLLPAIAFGRLEIGRAHV